jgi:uncharacterized membrane protein
MIQIKFTKSRAYVWGRQFTRSNIEIILFVLVALFMGVGFAVTVPLLWGYDEPAHMARAYQLSRGQLLPQRVGSQDFGGLTPVTLVNFARLTKLDRETVNPRESPRLRADVNDASLYRQESLEPLGATKVPYVFNGASAYPLFAYPSQIIAAWIAKITDASLYHAVMLSRLLTLVIYVVLATYSIWLLRLHRSKYILIVVALLPTSIAQAATGGTDALANGLAFMLFALSYLAIFDKEYEPGSSSYGRRLKLIGYFVAALLPLVKINLILISVAYVVLIWARGLRQGELLRRKNYVIQLTLALLMVVTPTVVWGLLTKDVAASINPGADVAPHQQLAYILGNPFEYVKVILVTFVESEGSLITGFFGRFGWTSVTLPMAVLIVCAMQLALAIAHSRPVVGVSGHRMIHLGYVALGVLSAVAAITILYLTNTPVSNDSVVGVQGRYFIPVAPYIGFGLSYFAPFRVSKNDSTMLRNNFYTIVSAFGLATSLVWYVYITY